MKDPGARFEAFLESLIKSLGYQNVLRNVEYHKSRLFFRQVDVSYQYVQDERIYLAVVEAKYSSNGSIRYKLRSPKKKKGAPTMDNLIDEVKERTKFVDADRTILTTNREFEPQVHHEAQSSGIVLIEGQQLLKLYRKIGGNQSIDDAIHTHPYQKRKHIIYV
ncbi:restriction endonuclease [Candidatus Woesearchaeota archaeon]|nr:restriction endonuclease [Candidatus Woesearchaeota archaeon]